MNLILIRAKIPILHSIRRVPNLLCAITQQHPGTSNNYYSSLKDEPNYYNIVPVLRPNASLHPPDGHLWKLAIEGEIGKNLHSGDFQKALENWEFFLQNTQSTHGIMELIEFALKNQGDDILKKNIESVWNLSRTILYASDFLAYLVLSMIKAGHLGDAKYFAKKFTIYGTSFIKPLKLLVQKRDLNFLEPFGLLLEEVYYNIPKRPIKAAKKNKFTQVEGCNVPEDGGGDQATIDKEKGTRGEDDDNVDDNGTSMHGDGREQQRLETKFKKLIEIWEPPKKRKNQQPRKFVRMRVHKVDEHKLAKLNELFLAIWVEKAVDNFDYDSWERLRDFTNRNRLAIPSDHLQRGEDIFGYTLLNRPQAQTKRTFLLQSSEQNISNSKIVD